jgi:ribosomal protein L37AE/L43A
MEITNSTLSRYLNKKVNAAIRAKLKAAVEGRKAVVRTAVRTVICPNCGDEIYSRANHDFRYCSCKDTFVDGGFDYLRYGGKVRPTLGRRRINATKGELYNDWNTRADKFGVFKQGKKVN